MSLRSIKPLTKPNNGIKTKSLYQNGISESDVKKDQSQPYVTSFTDIKTPTNVDEFRENLLKYYVSYDRYVMVGENDKTIGDIDVDSIESMDDLGFWDDFSWNGSDSHSPTLNLTPTVVQIRSFEDYTKENFVMYGGGMGMEELCVKWWLNPNNNIIVDYTHKSKNQYKNYIGLCKKYQKNVYWKNFHKDGNSLFRDFYQKTLGKFSGRGEWKYDDEGNRLKTEEMN